MISKLISMAGLTRKEAADLVGKDPRTVKRWEQGATRPDPAALQILSNLAYDRQARALTGAKLFSFVDLFAGIGGLRLGFERAGGRCVFTSEWDEPAQKTYAANFPDGERIRGDITTITADEV